MKTYLEEQKKWNETTYDGKHKEKNILRRRRRILKCGDIFLTYKASSKKLHSMLEK